MELILRLTRVGVNLAPDGPTVTMLVVGLFISLCVDTKIGLFVFTFLVNVFVLLENVLLGRVSIATNCDVVICGTFVSGEEKYNSFKTFYIAIEYSSMK